MNEWVVGMALAVLAAGCLSLAVAVRALRREVAALRAERRVVPAAAEDESSPARLPTAEPTTYVITAMDEPAPVPDRRIEGSLFADLVLRESVVKGVSFAHGVRRALAAESRNRIRFVMRQEVKRSRKQRRVDLRAARRQRSGLQRDEDAA